MNRLPRRFLFMAAVPCVGLALLFLLYGPTPQAPPLRPSPPAAASLVSIPALAPPLPLSDELRGASERAADPGRPLEDRIRALKTLARSPEPSPLLALLSGSGEDPDRAQLRAMVYSALCGYPEDPKVRAHLLATLGPDRPRGERLLAIRSLASLRSAEWCLPRLEELRRDLDPAVRQRALWAVEQLSR